MGIKSTSNRLICMHNADSPDLYQVISENAPEAIKTGEIKQHFGRKVAIVRILTAELSSSLTLR